MRLLFEFENQVMTCHHAKTYLRIEPTTKDQRTFEIIRNGDFLMTKEDFNVP